ncbi:MAG: FKBP-type peptidyl-prolyl cis-trans isomerase [Alistipes sp.]|nr:FKBP-type peptidyl-prolyl cis-trans isomerase [Alistipes sp.]
MKKIFILSGAAALLMGACTSTGGGSLKTTEDSLAYAMGLDMGTYVQNMDTMLDAKLNLSVIANAMKAVANGDTSVMSQKEAYDFMREYYTVVKPRKDSAASAEFIAKAEKENANIKKTASGLLYEVVTPGDESVKADSSSTVRVLYKMTDRNGKDIQNTYTKSDTANIPLSNVIPGWAEGMQLIGKGGKIKLWIPSDLAYGPQGRGQMIPANSALYYEVDLIDVLPAAATEAK